MARANLVGERFDKLLVIEWVEMTRSGSRWLCECDCGQTVIRTTSHLRYPSKFSACRKCYAAFNSDRFRTHGGTAGGRSPLYGVWRSMKGRCGNPKVREYKWYGAKGVTVCPEWREDFAAFREWALTNGYAAGLSIERKNSAGNYEPGNCEWITRAENGRRTAVERWSKLKLAR